ncbi:hypothetical protein MNO14_13650 [Luteimonas sp. S4-F44]|uniref:hypothetical protein n=1 Tax=Luteimonas sp. S4-F44 TaxID=2925842 RepID=UPI001F52F6D3|nr:hypothetical protein [Luteimonas sp. S4-F44]UNK41984.1 hypothetical protein MNO14_13650 [Luteimonas sp. S4-F44]
MARASWCCVATKLGWPTSLAAALSLSACGQAQPPAAAALPTTTVEAVTTPTREPTSADDMAADQDEPAGLPGGWVRDYFVTQYGELAQLIGTWPGAPIAPGLGADPAEREVCARAAVGSADAPAELVAVCGIPDGAGHVTSALVDLFLLEAGDGLAVAAARQHLTDYGSSGDVADVRVQRFGAALYGVVIEDGFTGQGITVGARSLLLPHAGGFREAATVRSSLEHDQAPEDALDLAFDLTVDDRDRQAPAWPLVVREHGQACGRHVDREYRLAFDPATGTWPIPAALQRDRCD